MDLTRVSAVTLFTPPPLFRVLICTSRDGVLVNFFVYFSICSSPAYVDLVFF